MAYKDYLHERLLSVCAILGLAAILCPLLVLYGVKYGIVHTLMERLSHDPRNLEISPITSGRFTADYFAQLAKHPDVAFVIPRTRSIAATMKIYWPSKGKLRSKEVLVSLEPSAPGDPLLERYKAAIPPMPANPAAEDIHITLSATAAEKLGVKPGDSLHGKVDRRYRGNVESAYASVHIAAVLPLAAQQKDVAYVPLQLAQATESYRDGRAVPQLGLDRGWSGDPLPGEAHQYPGFRLYANDLEAVVSLRKAFAAQNFPVYTHAEEIEQVTQLSQALTLIFALICAATATGFMASTASNVLASVKRKERVLALLRLNGFTSASLSLFPLAQTILTATLGTALASCLYLVAAMGINHTFQEHLADMEQLCRLLPEHFLLAFATVLALSLLAALGPTLRSTRIEPSEVIREY
jgi:putative ABC transport system permease protein